jgi:hypothetical protein
MREDVVTVTAGRRPNYQFDFWTGNVTDPSVTTTTVVMIGSDRHSRFRFCPWRFCRTPSH